MATPRWWPVVVAAAVVAAACSSGGRATTPGAATARPSSTTTTTASPATSVAATASTTTPTSAATSPAASATAVSAVPARAAAGACPAIPARLAPRDDRSRYTVTVAVDPVAGTATGTMSVAFTPDLATDRMVFRLWPNGPVEAAAGARLDTGAVTVDGAATPADRSDPTTLVVHRAVAAGERVTVAMPWSLTMARNLSDRNVKAGDAARLGTFLPLLPWEPGHGWALDPPTRVHGEASMAPTADFDLSVTAPAGYDVLATGVADRPGHWTATAVEDLAIAVGHFRTATATARTSPPVAVTVAADRGVADDPAPYAAKVARVIEQYSRRFGAYPWPSYTLAITPGLRGGIEYPMLVHSGPGALGRSTSHEVGHQYFYGLVENDQGRDPWLDEGLASWAEVGYEGTLASFRTRAIPAAARGQLGQPTSYWDTVNADYYTSVYVQGVQALDALGPQDKVDCALALYVATHAYRVARPADLISSLTAVFPDAATVLAKYGVKG